jgi:hypothetical protein
VENEKKDAELSGAPKGHCQRCGSYSLQVDCGSDREVTVHECALGRLSAQRKDGIVEWAYTTGRWSSCGMADPGWLLPAQAGEREGELHPNSDSTRVEQEGGKPEAA